MCLSPLVRFRLKRKSHPDKNIGVSYQWKVDSQRKLESEFSSYSEFRNYFDNYMDYQIIPCRKCDECKIKYAQDWSIRCYHEFQVRQSGCFLTLTIDSSKTHLFTDNLKTYCKRCVKGNRYIRYPIDYTLCKGFIFDWIKKFRDTIYKRYGLTIRYFGCGEYGSPENSERAHYHILIFGYNFSDRMFYKYSPKGIPIYLSKELSGLYPYGLATIQDINHRACMYTAKYVTKKLRFDNQQSEFEMYYGREPEFIFMSKGNCQSNRCPYIDEIIKNCKGIKSLRDLNNPYCKFCNKTRGGLGYDWFLKYKDDVLKKGFITIEGIKYSIPDYYLKILKLTDKEKYDKYIIDRNIRVDEKVNKHPEYQSQEHLDIKNKILKNRLKHCHRQ